MTRHPSAWRLTLLLAVALSPAGCGKTPINESFDRSSGESINATSALADLFRQRGHQVRSSRQLKDRTGAWADVVVRFSPEAGPPDRDEGNRMLEWLGDKSGRQIIYVPRDYDAGPEFWDAVLAAKDATKTQAWVDQVQMERQEAVARAGRPAPRSKTPSRPEVWFGLPAESGPAATAEALDGEWSEGVDPKAVRVARHDTFADGGENVLLADGDGRRLAITWSTDGDATVLAIANASFLLNGALAARPERAVLAARVVDWIGPEPRHVLFLDGGDILGEGGDDDTQGVFHLLSVHPFNWVAAHLAALALAAALARAVRLGRPRPEPPSGFDRPAAHPEALGGLLARTRREAAARELIDTYRRWRTPNASTSASAPASTSTPTPPASPPTNPRKHRS